MSHNDGSSCEIKSKLRLKQFMNTTIRTEQYEYNNILIYRGSFSTILQNCSTILTTPISDTLHSFFSKKIPPIFKLNKIEWKVFNFSIVHY